jgi:hypothetical protein
MEALPGEFRDIALARLECRAVGTPGVEKTVLKRRSNTPLWGVPFDVARWIALSGIAAASPAVPGRRRLPGQRRPTASS